MAIFGVAAVASAAAVLLQQVMMQWMFSGADAPADAAAMMTIMRTGSAVFGLVFVSVFTFLAIKLNAASVRAEFT